MPEIIVKLGDRIIHRYYFDKDVLSVGRARDNDIVIENLSVSRNHARIRREGDVYILTDMNSANGSYVNGTRATKTEVVHDDQITIGKHTLHFVNEGESHEESSSKKEDPGPSAADLSGSICILHVTKGKQAGQEFRVWKPETTIGRANENEIRLHDWFVSKRHAAIIRNGDTYLLRDLDSWRGTTVNGNSIKEIELGLDDEIVFGSTVLTFQTMPAEEVAKLGPPARPKEPIEAEADSEIRTTGDRVPVQDVSDDGDDEPVPAPQDDDSIALDMTDSAEETGHSAATNAPPGVVEDDEFSPLTEEELEALETEGEEDLVLALEEEEEHRRAEWEMLEAEKMFAQNESDHDDQNLIESDMNLAAEEEEAVGGNEAAKAGLAQRDDQNGASEAEVAAEAKDEEEALYGGEMTDNEPYGDPAEGSNVAAAEAKAGKKKEAAGSAANGEAKQREVAMWEKALKNKSAVIRKNAAGQLKKLTGKDYDWQSEPAGS